MEPGNRIKISELGKKSMIRPKRLNVHGTITSTSTIDGVLKYCTVKWDGRKTLDRFAPQFLEVIGKTDIFLTK